MLIERESPQCIGLGDGRIMAAGGVTEFTVEVYNPATESWSFIGDLPIGRDNGALVIHNGEVLLAGGYSFDVSQYPPYITRFSLISEEILLHILEKKYVASGMMQRRTSGWRSWTGHKCPMGGLPSHCSQCLMNIYPPADSFITSANTKAFLFPLPLSIFCSIKIGLPEPSPAKYVNVAHAFCGNYFYFFYILLCWEILISPCTNLLSMDYQMFMLYTTHCSPAKNL